jgi:three-Cys-motif partner protein
MIRNCKLENCKDGYGNCKLLADDKLPIQCIGEWSEEKYYVLERYLNATAEVRKKFAKNGNAVYIDLFSGPGKCIVQDSQKLVDGGGLRVLKGKTPFNDYYYFDNYDLNIKALKSRTAKEKNINAILGDSNVMIKNLIDILKKSKYEKYHFAFIDPFGPSSLKFDTIKALAEFKRMDLLIHFPLGSIKRNISQWKDKSKGTILDDFMGTTSWRAVLENASPDDISSKLIDLYFEQLKSIGYPEEGLHPEGENTKSFVTIKNSKDVILYVLILASKIPIAQKIWKSTISKNINGQPDLF